MEPFATVMKRGIRVEPDGGKSSTTKLPRETNMQTSGYTWVWSWDEYTNDSPDPDRHWITVYETNGEGWGDEVCVIVLRHQRWSYGGPDVPTTEEIPGWRDMIPDREAKAALIVEALEATLHAAGG